MPAVLDLILERAPGIMIEGILPRAEFAQDILSGTVDLVCFAYPLTSPDISIVPVCPVDTGARRTAQSSRYHQAPPRHGDVRRAAVRRSFHWTCAA